MLRPDLLHRQRPYLFVGGMSTRGLGVTRFFLLAPGGKSGAIKTLQLFALAKKGILHLLVSAGFQVGATSSF